MNALVSTILISFIGMAVVAIAPAERKGLIRWLALAAAGSGLVAAALAARAYDPRQGGVWTAADWRWIPMIGARFRLGGDGISLVLVLLTGIAAVAGVLFSWNIEHRTKEFFILYLALIGAVYGVFLSLDLFLLFLFYELAIIPKYFLIAIWGSTQREYGAMKLALYSFIGSGLVLIGIVGIWIASGGRSLALADLSNVPFSRHFQWWAFPVVFLGFAILAGIWPFHTWAPTGHVAAPTAASMLLAGVVMKLGAYGALRVAVGLFPVGLAAWRGVFGCLAVFGIVYGALAALAQRDFKFVIGYSSVSHMGFVLLGLAALNKIGLTGAVLQMFSHGVIAGLLFAVVGRMVYDRTHTRDLNSLEEMELNKALPFAAGAFALACMASMGLPGFSGFVAELSVLSGAWQVFPALAFLGGLGILIGVAYTLRALQKSFFGQRLQPAEGPPLSAISLPERAGAILLLAATLWAGLFPRFLIELISSGLNSPLFQALGPLR